MGSNWKKDLDDSLQKASNLFMTGDLYTRFAFSSEKEDSDAEVKNALKKKKLYVMALVLWLVFVKVISIVVTMIMNMLQVPYYGTTQMKVRYIIIFLDSIGFLVIVSKWKKQGKEAKSVYDEKIVSQAVQEVLPGAEFEPDGSMDADRLWVLGVVPEFNRASGSYLINYKKDGKLFGFSNLALFEREKDNHDEYYYKQVFAGQAFVLHYKSRMQGCVRIMTTGTLMGREYLAGFRKLDKSKEEKIETENQVFNGQFDVYATNAHSAFYVLTPLVMERLLAMKKKYGIFGVAVSGTEIAIALSTGYFLFEAPRSYQKIENISIENSKNQIRQMLSFAQLIEDSINGRVIK